MGASKSKMLFRIPSRFRPCTILNTNVGERLQIAKRQMMKEGLDYPIIVKPDIGERGLLVELINNDKELCAYLQANNINIIIQEFIDFPKECGIFYIRKPSQEKGEIVSIGLKKYFTLNGDGISTIEQLMLIEPRYKLQIERYRQCLPEILGKVLSEGETFKIDPIGNHNRGTLFIDGSHLISEKLYALFDEITSEMQDVYYGRFDIKYNSWGELLEGKNLRILEMNGVASEPIHVYDNNVPIKDKYKAFYSLWKTIFEISNLQKQRGILPIKSKTGFKDLKNYQNYIRSINHDWRKNIAVG